MPALLPLKLGNGKRPSDPAHSAGGPEDTVPILEVAEETHEIVGAGHDAALDPDDDTQLLTHAFVLVDNPSPLDGSRPGPITVSIGGSTLHEAATEVIACVHNLCTEMPAWVASSDPDLAAVLAEHFTVRLPATDEKGKAITATYNECQVIALEDVHDRAEDSP